MCGRCELWAVPERTPGAQEPRAQSPKPKAPAPKKYHPTMLSIAQATPAQIPEVRMMIREYLDWTKSFGDDSQRAPTFASVDRELETLPGVFAPPKGRLLVGTIDGQVGGCVALKPHDHGVAELKRLYVRPSFRGHNLGRLLVQALVDQARSCGYKRLILDSHKSMTQAHAIYRAFGFMDVPAPADFPDDLKSIAIFMELDLERAAVVSAE